MAPLIFDRLLPERAKNSGLVVDIGLEADKLEGRSPHVFIRTVVEATHPHVAAYYLDFWSFVPSGSEAINHLVNATKIIKEADSMIPIIMGVTRVCMNAAYFSFVNCGVDAMVIPLHPHSSLLTLCRAYPTKGFFELYSNTDPEEFHLLDYTPANEVVPSIVGGKMVNGNIGPLFNAGFETKKSKNLLVKVGQEITYCSTDAKVIYERARYYKERINACRTEA